MTLLCQFKNILGKPGEGIHSYRIMGFALWDIVGTVGLGWILSKFISWNVLKSTIFMFLFGTFLHWLFCVDTAFMKFIFYTI